MIKVAKRGSLLDRSSLLAEKFLIQHFEWGDINDLSNEGHEGLIYPASSQDADIGQGFPAFDPEFSGSLRHVLVNSYLDALEEIPEDESEDPNREKNRKPVDGGEKVSERNNYVPLTTDGAHSDIEKNVRFLMVFELACKLAENEIEVPRNPPANWPRRFRKKAAGLAL